MTVKQTFNLCIFVIMTAITVFPVTSGAVVVNDPIFGWQFRLPDDWKADMQGNVDSSASGHPGWTWMFSKNPMTYVAYQVVDHDVRDQASFERYKKDNFDAISASMQHTAQKAGAEMFTNQDEVSVGGHVFQSLLWVLKAPGRSELKNMTLVGALSDKAVTIGISCTGADCDTAFGAIDASYFSKLPPPAPSTPPPSSIPEPAWNFAIPVGWTRVAVNSPEEKLVIEKGEDNSLSYVLIEDKDRELELRGLNAVKGEIFAETLSQFQQIASENGLQLNSAEEVVNLGNISFQTMTMALNDPGTNTPMIVASQLLGVVRKHLAMISVTCTSEAVCSEIQEALEQSSFR